MDRIAPWLAIVFAAVIAVVAVFEIDMRSEEDDLALEPTTVPSPTVAPTTDGPTTAAPTTTAPGAMPPAPTDTPAATVAPSPTQAPTEAPTASPAAEPTSAPATTAPPAGADPMPHTGGGAVPAGIALIALAGTLKLAARRSY
jgi:hypothetical protein